LVRDRGTVRTSTTKRTAGAARISTNWAIVRVEWPTV